MAIGQLLSMQHNHHLSGTTIDLVAQLLSVQHDYHSNSKGRQDLIDRQPTKATNGMLGKSRKDQVGHQHDEENVITSQSANGHEVSLGNR